MSMETSLDYDYLFKYILVGDASVGKSALLNMFINGAFISDSNPTMGVQFATKKIQVGSQNIKVQIWDTAGQQSFRTITRAYYKNAVGVILVYDLANLQSIASLKSWLLEINDNSTQKAKIIVVGNKSDLTHPPNISPLPQFQFISTSAKTGHNVNKIFTTISSNILQGIKKGQIDPQKTPGVQKGRSSRKGLKLDNIQDNGKINKKCC